MTEAKPSYQVQTIRSEEEIDRCQLFQIDRFNWGGSYRPRACGRMGFLPDQGFYVKMTCQEKDPPVFHLEPGSQVYLDSAMEVFLCFTPQETHPVYLNLEMNAAGVLLAAYGSERFPRSPFSQAVLQQFSCQGEIGTGSWSVSLLIPLVAVREAYPGLALPLSRGSRFTCNFFKLREQEGEDQHFASFAPIVSEQPLFHLPAFFADARIV